MTTTDGTGVVHTAVMYGEDDYALGKKVGLPEYHTVDEEGKFTKDVPDLAGLYVKANGTEEKIFEHLKRNGNFLRTEKYEHEYPHCWRCDTPILYYARDSWFIAMSKLRTRAFEAEQEHPLDAGVYPRWADGGMAEGGERLESFARAVLGRAASDLGMQEMRAYGSDRAGLTT